jgi:hypothetical protein
LSQTSCSGPVVDVTVVVVLVVVTPRRVVLVVLVVVLVRIDLVVLLVVDVLVVVVEQLVTGVCTHPLDGSQPSRVQASRSSHVRRRPPVQVPPWQRSAVVHALRSSQGAVFRTTEQPEAGSQRLSVQGFPSSHVGGGPFTQT